MFLVKTQFLGKNYYAQKVYRVIGQNVQNTVMPNVGNMTKTNY